jgi:hypothetical protein
LPCSLLGGAGNPGREPANQLMNTEQVTGRRENLLAAHLGAVLAVRAGPARGQLLPAAVGQHHHQERLAPQSQAIPYA